MKYLSNINGCTDRFFLFPESNAAKRYVRYILFLFFFISLLATPPGHAADIEAAIGTIRSDIFKESSHGIPGITVEDIDTALVTRLYSVPGALKALQRILPAGNYKAINYRIGEIRQKTSLRIWAEIAKEKGIRIELNNGGKTSGALSDLDITIFTDAWFYPNDPDNPVRPDTIHEDLIKLFEERWKAHFGGLDPGKFDHMHFAGDTIMADWRMSKAHWSHFLAKLDTDIARLSAEPGAYFVPGGYKPQVYGRYIMEGKAFVIQPAIYESANPDIEGVPDGVAIAEMPISHASIMYSSVPVEPDRTAVLESILHNYQWAQEASVTMKEAKFNNRWNDTGLMHLVNIEADFRRLMLEGRYGEVEGVVSKLFQEYADSNQLPGDIGDIDELRRVLEVMTRIELDKIIATVGDERPGHWSDEWKEHQPRNIEDPKTKLEYFQKEADAIRYASHAGLDIPEADLADMAERAFMDKARGVARLSAAVASKSLYGKLFTRDGFTRLRSDLGITGLMEARRLIAERVRGLHAALAFQNDPAMIRSVLEAVPPEARPVVEKIAKIAENQRAEVLSRQSTFDQITADQLRESDQILEDLMRELGLDPFGFEWQNIHMPVLDINLEAQAQRNIACIMKDALIEQARTLGNYTVETVIGYFTDISETTASGFGKEYLTSFWDISTVDAAGKVLAKLAADDINGARQEMIDAVIENCPIAGTYYTIFKANRDWTYQRNIWPSLMFIGQKGLGSELATKFWPTDIAGGMFGHLVALYGLESALFEVGWHVAGKPTQNEVLSIALMGDTSSLETKFDCRGFTSPGILERMRNRFNSWRGGRFRPDEIPAPEWEKLKNNSLLRRMVKLDPGMPAAIRRMIVRSYYLPVAQREALKCGFGLPNNRTEETWEHYMDTIYQRNWDYWIRRAFFYEQTHLKFFNWVGQIVRNRNWQDLSSDPPVEMTVTQQNLLKQDWPDVYVTRLGGGGDWDHERYWLRNYLSSQWIQKWEQEIPENGEFFRQAGAIAGDWKKALLDELVTYYLEGERFSLNVSGISSKRNAQERQQDEQKSRDGFWKTAERILGEESVKAVEKQKKYEKLYWFAGIVDSFVDSIVTALWSKQVPPPPGPSLKVRVLRPVMLKRGSFPFGFTVIGHINDLPVSAEHFDLTLSYEKLGESPGQKPGEVLVDDIRTLFKGDYDTKYFNYVKYNVTFTLKYKGDNIASLTDQKIVWLIDWLREEDDHEDGTEGSGSDDDTGTTGGAPEDGGIAPGESGTGGEEDSTPVPGGTRRTTPEKEDPDCVAARESISGIESSLTSMTGRMDSLETRTEKLETKFNDIGDAYKEIEDAQKEADKASLEIVEAKQKMEKLALEICRTAEKLGDPASPEEAQTLSDKIKEDYKKVGTLKSKTSSALRTSKKAAENAERIYNKYKPVMEELKQLLKDLDALTPQLETVRKTLEKARKRVTTGTTSRRTGSDTEDDCRTAVNSVIDLREDERNTIIRTITSIRALVPDVGILKDWLNKMEKAVSKARSAADAAGVYKEAVDDLAAQAGTCVAAAGELPMKVWFIVSVSGEGWVPMWNGKSNLHSGMDEFIIELKRGAKLGPKLREIYEGLKIFNCDVLRVPAMCPCTRPTVWTTDPIVSKVAGPFENLREVSGRELKNTWKIIADDGPSLLKLREMTGCANQTSGNQGN